MPIHDQVTQAPSLTKKDYQRLARVSLWFGINPVESAGGVDLVFDEGFSSGELPVPTAQTRLLAEICGRCAPWIAFNFRTPCKETLFALTDTRIRRIAELYRLAQKKSA